MKLRPNYVSWGAVCGAGLAILVGVLLRYLHFGNDVAVGQRLIDLSYDIPFGFRAAKQINDVVIVYMDEESHRALNQSYGKPWDRLLHAQLLRRLKEEGAKIVVMDIFFREPGDETVNPLLAQAMKEHGQVIIGAQFQQTGIENVAVGHTLIYPLDIFRQSVAGVGLIELIGEPDFSVRRHFSGDYERAEFIPGLAWKAAELMQAPITQKPQSREVDRWLNYYGPPGTIPNISYHQVLRPDGAPPNFLRDKVVFVGHSPNPTGFTGESKEEFRTPYTWWTHRFGSGVEVHATMFLNLTRQDWLRRLGPIAELFILATAGFLFGGALFTLRPLHGTFVAVGGVALCCVLASFMVWKMGVWFAWTIVAGVQIPVAYLSATLFNSLRLLKEKHKLEQSLALHLSPARVQQILKQPHLLAPGADKIEISILFSDIANFTKITARMEPGDLFKLLNNYFETSLGCIHKTDGTVIKLIGDAIFAIWNAPFPQDNHQERACLAALKLQEQLIQFDASQQSLPLRTRVGLHTGTAYVGNVGSSKRFDYTAIGDSINLSSRLEGLNKYLGTDILATRDIQKAVESRIVSRMVGHFKFKGFDRIVEVHELIATGDKAKDSEAWRKTFSEAMYQLQRQDFDAAEAAFRCVLEMRHNDGPAAFYLEQISDYRKNPPSKDWAGEIELKEK